MGRKVLREEVAEAMAANLGEEDKMVRMLNSIGGNDTESDMSLPS
jgi:hypothetical protein